MQYGTFGTFPPLLSKFPFLRGFQGAGRGEGGFLSRSSALFLLADAVEHTMWVLTVVCNAMQCCGLCGASSDNNGTYPYSPGAGRGVMIGTRNNEFKRYFKGEIGEVIVYPRALSQTERAAVLAYLAAQWPAAAGSSSPAACPSSPSSDSGYNTSQMCRDYRRACFPTLLARPCSVA